jgi:16S rRNA (guanine966-N2)-methyltransferase
VTRIIAGAAGSLRLEVPKAGTRPTSDRVREAIFSALESWNLVEGSRVLDLYAGSGALGLEAASRGAAAVVLVEKHPQAAQIAAKNAKTVRGAFRAAGAPEIEVARSSVQSYLDLRTPAPLNGAGAAASGERFDVIMLDPPYDLSEQELAMNIDAAARLLSPEGVIMVERSSRSPEPRWPDGLAQFKEKRYGETVLWWAEIS